MKIGTLACKLFGHKFIGKRIVYEPHYRKLAKQGFANALFDWDYHWQSFKSEYCARCGKLNASKE